MDDSHGSAASVSPVHSGSFDGDKFKSTVREKKNFTRFDIQTAETIIGSLTVGSIIESECHADRADVAPKIIVTLTAGQHSSNFRVAQEFESGSPGIDEHFKEEVPTPKNKYVNFKLFIPEDTFETDVNSCTILSSDDSMPFVAHLQVMVEMGNIFESHALDHDVFQYIQSIKVVIFRF